MNGRARVPQTQMTPVLFDHHMVLIGLAQGKFIIILGISFILKFFVEVKSVSLISYSNGNIPAC